MSATSTLHQKGVLSDSFSNLSLVDKKTATVSAKEMVKPAFPTQDVTQEWTGLVQSYFEAKESETPENKANCLNRMAQILTPTILDHLVGPLCTPGHIQKLIHSLHSTNKGEQFQAFHLIVRMTEITNDEPLFELLVSHGLLIDISTLIRWNVNHDLVSISFTFLTNLGYNHSKKYADLLIPLVPYLKPFLKDWRIKLRTEAFFAFYCCARHLPESQIGDVVQYLLETGSDGLSTKDYLEINTYVTALAKDSPAVQRMLDVRASGTTTVMSATTMNDG